MTKRFTLWGLGELDATVFKVSDLDTREEALDTKSHWERALGPLNYVFHITENDQ